MGKKKEQRRDGVRFTMIDLKRETLGDMDDKSTQAEGYPSIEMYKNLILNMSKA